MADTAPVAPRNGRPTLRGRERKQRGLLLLLKKKNIRIHANNCKPNRGRAKPSPSIQILDHNYKHGHYCSLASRLDGGKSVVVSKQKRRQLFEGLVVSLLLSLHGVLISCYDLNATPLVHSVGALRLQYPHHADPSFVGQSTPTLQLQPQHPPGLNPLQTTHLWNTTDETSLHLSPSTTIIHHDDIQKRFIPNGAQSLPVTSSFSPDPLDEVPNVGGGNVAGIADIFSAIFNNQQNNNNNNNDNNNQNQRPPRDSLDGHVRKILIPRVSGTPGNVQVRNYIVDFLKKNNYHVQLDQFKDRTPIGEVAFANIIATSDPNACRQLVIACHHDSKKMDGFLGAIDSAVPCAMMLELAQAFNRSFRHTDEPAKARLGLSFVFFDGEEAFVDWTETDSLYGSRHLAKKWELQPSPDECPGKNELSRIELLVVLDLIGTTDTHFVMYNRQLKQHYQTLQSIEKAHLSNKRLSSSQVKAQSAFRSRYIPLEFMQDDHVPFYKRGVPTLSLLASPFPSVWHTIGDNYQAIDFERTKHLLHVLSAFIDDYKPIETKS